MAFSSLRAFNRPAQSSYREVTHTSPYARSVQRVCIPSERLCDRYIADVAWKVNKFRDRPVRLKEIISQDGWPYSIEHHR